MDEYIKREEAIKIAESYKPQNGSSFCRNRGIADYIAEDISMIPSADVAPVRHGRWVFGKDLPCGWWKILKNMHHLYCSECLEQAFNRSEDNDPDFDVDTTYCPACGCCMDGGAE